MPRDDQFCTRSVTGEKIFRGIGAQQSLTPGGFPETFTIRGMPLIPVALVMEIMLIIANFLAFIAR